MKKIFLSLLMGLYTSPALAQSNIDDLLERAAQAMQSTISLEADFQQEKQIAFLDAPLMAKGKLCFHRAPDSPPYIFWEYRSPARSGFQYENGEIRLWYEGVPGKKASPSEKVFLESMAKQILCWITLDREAIGREYVFAHVQGKARSILLTPRKEHSIFKSIELEFSENFTTLSGLKMVGRQDDVTIFTFLPLTVNTEISDDCHR